MASGFKVTGAAVSAALLLASVPAAARPGWGNGGHHRHYRHGDGFDFGDFLLGGLIVGGIAAAVSSSSRERRGERVADRSATYAQDDAADACAEAAERQASRDGGSARVDDIDHVIRDGGGWRVEGRVADGESRSARRFVCGVHDGQVDFVQLGGAPAAWQR